jgi:hypothetical protein
MLNNEIAKALDKIESRLKSLEWRNIPDMFRMSALSYYKFQPTKHVCCLNREKPGIQVCIQICTVENVIMISASLRAQLPDNTWIDINKFSLPDDIEAVLALVPELVKTWEAAYEGARASEPGAQ